MIMEYLVLACGFLLVLMAAAVAHELSALRAEWLSMKIEILARPMFDDRGQTVGISTSTRSWADQADRDTLEPTGIHMLRERLERRLNKPI